MRAAVNIPEVLLNFNAKPRNLLVVESSKQQFSSRVNIAGLIDARNSYVFRTFFNVDMSKVFFKRKV